MSTITITAPNGATCSIDLADMFGPAVHNGNGTSKAPSKPAPAPTPAASEQAPAPEASKPAKAGKAPKASKASKDERKAANLALAQRIYTLADQGKYTEAIALATERGWPSVVTTVQKRREQALATSAMVHAPLSEASEADTGKVADALVKQAGKGKGRPASERCATHNTFLKADGTCGKCQGKGKGKPAPAPAPAPQPAPEQAPEPEQAVEGWDEPVTILTPAEAHSLQEHEQFPAGLSEADLVLHWRTLASKPYGRNMLQAIRKRCLKGVANMGLSTDERTIWAQRRQAVTEILAA